MPSDWHYTALLDTVLARLPHSGELDEQSILELAAVLDNDLLGALNLIDHGQVRFVPRPFDPNSPLTRRSVRKRERQAIVDDSEGQRPPKLVYTPPSISPAPQQPQAQAAAPTGPRFSVPPTKDSSVSQGNTTAQGKPDDTVSAPCAPATTTPATTCTSRKDADTMGWNPSFCSCATSGMCVHILAVRIAQQLGRCETPDPQGMTLMWLVDAMTPTQPPPE